MKDWSGALLLQCFKEATGFSIAWQLPNSCVAWFCDLSTREAESGENASPPGDVRYPKGDTPTRKCGFPCERELSAVGYLIHPVGQALVARDDLKVASQTM